LTQVAERPLDDTSEFALGSPRTLVRHRQLKKHIDHRRLGCSMLEIKRMTNNRDALEPGTVINGYEIDTIIGGGRFSVVYRARHILLREFVAIKEYFPLELAVRRSDGVYPHDSVGSHFHEGLRRFVDEARILVRFRDDPTIVSCRDQFELNGTAYLVMEWGLYIAPSKAW